MAPKTDVSSLVTELNSRSLSVDGPSLTHLATPTSSSSTVIGTGTCGTIFAGGVSSPNVAIKVGTSKRGLEQDFRLLQKTNEAFHKCNVLFGGTAHRSPIPSLPAYVEFFSPEHVPRRLPELPTKYHEGNYAYAMERIQSFSVAARRTLLKMFPNVHDRVEDTHDCLIRPYLGEKETADNSGPSTLQNVPLFLDQMIALGLDCSLMAQEMAVGLAILHWQARIDAIDVEFVLGASRTDIIPVPCQSRSESESRNDMRKVSMWILDFDKATDIQLDDPDVVKRLAGGMQGNDNYFPKPDLDPGVWLDFKNAYLEASKKILISSHDADAMSMSLPEQVLAEYCAMHTARSFQVAEWDPFEREEGDYDDEEEEGEEDEDEDEDYEEGEEDDSDDESESDEEDDSDGEDHSDEEDEESDEEEA